MHMQFELSVRGRVEIYNELSQKNVRFQRRMRAIVKNYGESTRGLVMFFSPVDTTFMQQHVKTWYSEDKLVFEVGWDVMDFVSAGKPFYPFFQEFGTVNHPAQPSLRPAFADQSPLFSADVRRAAEDEWRRLGSPG